MRGYRTYIAAALVALFGVLASTDWISFLDDPKAGAVAIASAVIMAVMRSVTSGPATSALGFLTSAHQTEGARTYTAALLVAIFGVLASADWVAFLNSPKAGAVAIGSAMIMAAMRAITTTPPGVKPQSIDAPIDAAGAQEESE